MKAFLPIFTYYFLSAILFAQIPPGLIPDSITQPSDYQQQYFKNRFQTKSVYPPVATRRDSILQKVYHWKWGACKSVQGYKDHYIFVSQGCLLQCLDISNPRNPVVVSEYDLGTPYLIRIQGDILFVHVYPNDDIQIYDISDVRNIQLLSTIPDGGANMELYDSLLVAGSLYGKVTLYNISDPENPRYYSALYLPYVPSGIALFKDYLYLSDSYYPSYYIFDISNPYNPVLISINGTYNGNTDIEVFDEHLFILDGGTRNLKIYQLSDPENPELIGWLGLDSLAGGGMMKQDTVLIISNGLSVTSISVADLYHPKLVSFSWDTTNQYIPCGALGRSGNYLLKPFMHCFVTWEMLPDYSFRKVHQFNTAERVNAFAHKDNYLYLGCGSSGIWMFDISDPENPVQLKNIFLGMKVLDLKTYNDLLIVYGFVLGGGRQGIRFKIFNISNPVKLQYLSEFYSNEHELWSFDFEIQDSLLYIAAVDSGIMVVDIHNPNQPLPVSYYYVSQPGGQTVHDISLYGNYLYLANKSYGLKILDISDPYQITLVTSINNLTPNLVLAKDNYLFVAQNSCSQIYDITYSTSPILISEVSVGGYREQIIDDNKKYWYLSKSSITYLIDISDINNPVIEDTLLSLDALYLKPYLLYNKYLFVNEHGFYILDNKNISTSIGHRSAYKHSINMVNFYPNPFNQNITFEIQTRSIENLSLNIYDIIGRLVWSKEFNTLSDGEKICWNGISNQGKAVSSSIYFFRVVKGDRPVSTGKIMLLK